jgi:S1-C subfamily serine protease
VSILVLLCALGAPAALASGEAWLGIHLRAAPEAGPGIEVGAVVVDSPAARAGLRARDVILALDGEPVSDPSQLVQAVQQRGDGAWIPLTVRRGDRQLDLRARLDSRPENPERRPVHRGSIGAAAIDLPPSLREHFGAPATAGAMVFRVDPGSTAEAAGLRIGDVVFEIDGRSVGSAGQLHAMLSGGGVGNVAELAVARDGATLVLDVLIEEQPAELAGQRGSDSEP